METKFLPSFDSDLNQVVPFIQCPGQRDDKSGANETMKGVTSEVIAEVRARASLLDVISDTVVLKRTGKEYKGLCPFHKEKTPSFNVNPEKGIFKCFGCNEGGDVFAFVQRIKGTDFIDAVRDLAHRYGVPLAETADEREEHDHKSQIRMLYEQSCLYFERLLEQSQEGYLAREYLKQRGIDEEITKRFRLGFASPAWDGLLSYLTKSQSLSGSFLEQAGLVRQKQNSNSYYDLFRNRLIIPISDSEGRVIAFGGRTLVDDQIKYLNSPESPIYTKGQHLFGLNLARESIKQNDGVILVEGYFDAITPHQFGFTNTVATLGTALTEAQAKLLVRYTESRRVYLSFDADAAGERAVERGVETLAQIAEGVGIELHVIRIPGGKDPDECLRNQMGTGPELFAKAIAEAPLLIDYQLEQAFSSVKLTSHTGRIEAGRLVVPILGRLSNAIVRMEYIRQVASRLNMPEEEILTEVRSYRKANGLEAQKRGGWFERQGESGDGHSRSQSGSYGNKPYGNKGYNNSKQGFAGKGGGNSGGGKSRSATATKNGGSTATMNVSMAPMPKSKPVGHRLADIENIERQILAHYLVSRDDYDRVHDTFRDDKLVTPEHNRIKEAIEGIGTQFRTMEDLQHRLQDRLALESDLSSHLTELILKVDEIKKQNLPLDVVLKDYRARMLKERLSTLLAELSSELKRSEDDAEQYQLQWKCRELRQLKEVELKTLEDINDLKRKIDSIEKGESPKLETKE